ncbi:MAG: hypothetical protein M1522_08685 [Actinobacteria bacterium]|jgi:hypothetical protein|nr:hypothetical protein [Actinomycetota bacterium]
MNPRLVPVTLRHDEPSTLILRAAHAAAPLLLTLRYDEPFATTFLRAGRHVRLVVTHTDGPPATYRLAVTPGGELTTPGATGTQGLADQASSSATELPLAADRPHA